MKKILCIVVFGLGILFSTGCAAFSAGPRMMATIGEGAVSMGTTLAAKMNPKDMTANTSGRISDPRFTFRGHVATGVIFEFSAQLIGADLEYGITAGGQGMSEPDPIILEAISSIWGNSSLSEDQRQVMVAEAITNWMARKLAPPVEK